MQWRFSLPNWLLVIWLFLCVMTAGEIQHLVGPEGAFEPVFISSSFSTKDKAVYWFSNIIFVLLLILFIDSWSKAGFIVKVIMGAVLLVFLLNVPVRLFGSQELRQTLTRNKK